MNRHHEGAECSYQCNQSISLTIYGLAREQLTTSPCTCKQINVSVREIVSAVWVKRWPHMQQPMLAGTILLCWISAPLWFLAWPHWTFHSYSMVWPQLWTIPLIPCMNELVFTVIQFIFLQTRATRDEATDGQTLVDILLPIIYDSSTALLWALQQLVLHAQSKLHWVYVQTDN